MFEVDAVVVFTVASVNLIKFKLTINTANKIRLVITRIKLVNSLLPLKLKIALVVMVVAFCCVAMMIRRGSQLYFSI